MRAWMRPVGLVVGVVLAFAGLVVGLGGGPSRAAGGPDVVWDGAWWESSVTAVVTAVEADAGPDPQMQILGLLGVRAVAECPRAVYTLKPAQGSSLRFGPLLGCAGALSVGERVPVRPVGYVMVDDVTPGWAMPAPIGAGWPGLAVAVLGAVLAFGCGRAVGWVRSVVGWVPVPVIASGLVLGAAWVAAPAWTSMFADPWGWTESEWFAAAGLVAALGAGAVAVFWVLGRSRGWLAWAARRRGFLVGVGQTLAGAVAAGALWATCHTVHAVVEMERGAAAVGPVAVAVWVAGYLAACGFGWAAMAWVPSRRTTPREDNPVPL